MDAESSPKLTASEKVGTAGRAEPDKATILWGGLAVVCLGIFAFSLIEVVKLGIVLEGTRKLDAGQAVAAGGDFSYAIGRFRPSADPFFFRAISASIARRFADGIADLDAAMALGAPKTRLILTRAALEAQSGDAKKAIADCTAAIANDAQLGDAYKLRAVLNLRSANYAAAEADSTKALELCKEPGVRMKLYQVRAATRLHGGRVDEAIQDLNHAINANSSIQLRFMRADAYFKDGGYQQAALDYGAILVSAPKSDGALVARGLCEVKLGQSAAAQQDFSAALAIRPQAAGAYLGCGELSASKGDWQLAAENFNKALALDPQNKEAQGALAAASGHLNTRNRH